MTTEIYFENKNCGFTFDLEAKEINGWDSTDKYNDVKCYNKTSRSIKKALANLQKEFNDSLSMYEVMDIIRNSGVKMRSYCGMD